MTADPRMDFDATSTPEALPTEGGLLEVRSVDRPEAATESELALAVFSLEALLANVLCAPTWDAVQSARRALYTVDEDTRDAALLMLESPQPPERLDLLEEVLIAHTDIRAIVSLLKEREHSASFRVGLLSVLAGHIQSGNAREASTVGVALETLGELQAVEDVGVRIALVEALDRIVDHLPESRNLLSSIASNDSSDAVREHAEEVLYEHEKA